MSLKQYATRGNEINEITGGTPPAAFLDPPVLGEVTNLQDVLVKTQDGMRYFFPLLEEIWKGKFCNIGTLDNAVTIVGRWGTNPIAKRRKSKPREPIVCLLRHAAPLPVGLTGAAEKRASVNPSYDYRLKERQNSPHDYPRSFLHLPSMEAASQ